MRAGNDTGLVTVPAEISYDSFSRDVQLPMSLHASAGRTLTAQSNVVRSHLAVVILLSLFPFFKRPFQNSPFSALGPSGSNTES